MNEQQRKETQGIKLCDTIYRGIIETLNIRPQKLPTLGGIIIFLRVLYLHWVGYLPVKIHKH